MTNITAEKHDGFIVTNPDGNAITEFAGTTPHENLNFLLFCGAVIRGVHLYGPLLRAVIASAANDHRLGAIEAPPAILSVYLGDQLEAVFNDIKDGNVTASSDGGVMDLGLSQILPFTRDPDDRNRTSPFAFTGNRFEFRAVGSSQSVSGPLVAMNTMLADSLDWIADEPEAELTGGKGQLVDRCRSQDNRRAREDGVVSGCDVVCVRTRQQYHRRSGDRRRVRDDPGEGHCQRSQLAHQCGLRAGGVDGQLVELETDVIEIGATVRPVGQLIEQLFGSRSENQLRDLRGTDRGGHHDRVGAAASQFALGPSVLAAGDDRQVRVHLACRERDEYVGCVIGRHRRQNAGTANAGTLQHFFFGGITVDHEHPVIVIRQRCSTTEGVDGNKRVAGASRFSCILIRGGPGAHHSMFGGNPGSVLRVSRRIP
jgi:hypothetical protein